MGKFLPVIHINSWIGLSPGVLVRDFWGGASVYVAQAFQVGGSLLGAIVSILYLDC